MEVADVKKRQLELASKIEILIQEHIEQTKTVPVVEVHCHDHKAMGAPTTYVPVVRIYSVIPEVAH